MARMKYRLSAPSKEKVKWESRNIIRWIKSCKSDNGIPKLIQVGDINETRSILAICSGRQNKVPAASPTRFTDINPNDLAVLTSRKKDWTQLIRGVDLLHSNERIIDVRLN